MAWTMTRNRRGERSELPEILASILEARGATIAKQGTVWEASLPEPHASVTPHCYSLVQSWTLDHDERDGLSCSILERRNMAPAVSNCVQLDPMVTHHFKPDHIEKGYEAFGHQGGGVLKAGRHRSACAGVAW